MARSTLDLEDDAELSALAHRILDDVFLEQRTVPSRRLFRPIPRRVRESLAAPLGASPRTLAEAYTFFKATVAPYTTGNRHPRFMAWLMGAGTNLSPIVGLLGGALEVNACGGAQASTLVEAAVLEVFKDAFGLPKEASGLLTSGTSLANILGLAIAREERSGLGVRQHGLAGAPPLVVYASTDAHLSVHKAVELLGLGRDGLSRVPLDRRYRLDLDALRAAVAGDRAAGKRPIAIVATAGSASTGAIDDLSGAAEVARAEGLWLHVDGAFGAAVALSDRLGPLVAGIEQADSIAFDLHKWLHAPYGTGALLVRDPQAHRRTFTGGAPYLSGGEGGFAASSSWAQDLGIELSRPFSALGPWLSLQVHGRAGLGEALERSDDLATYLANRIAATPALELVHRGPLPVVLFRAAGAGLDDKSQDSLQNRIASRLHARGRLALSLVPIEGRLTLRAAVLNHRTTEADLDRAIADVVAELTNQPSKIVG